LGWGCGLTRTRPKYTQETEPTITVDEVRRRIGQFRISGAFQTQRMELLSGGQKSRVAFCKATWHLPHLLLLGKATSWEREGGGGAATRGDVPVRKAHCGSPRGWLSASLNSGFRWSWDGDAVELS